MKAWLAALALASSPADGVKGVFAGTVWTGTGPARAKAVVLFEGGRIERIEERAPPVGDAGYRSWPEGFVTPGLVDAHAHLGARADLVEDTFAVTPDARAIDVFEPTHRDFARAARAGITTALLAPLDENLVGGLAALVKTAGAADRRVLRPEALLKVSFGAAARRADREPTSQQGAAALLRREIRRAREAGGSGALPRCARGELAALAHAGTAEEIFAAGRFAPEFGLKFNLVHAPLAGEMSAFLKERGIGVVCGPYDASTPLRWLRSPAALEGAGVPIAFCTDGPERDPEALRLTAALAVRAGLDPDRALRALTVGAASLLGATDRIGSIEPGRDADLVVWSGNPLDLGSRVLAVFAGGELWFEAGARRPRRPGEPIPAEEARP
ncbi:MAG TPA: amidohydrolase family protein [Planctomycetota bacterium]|nr:amidohydrolase family protein [Planctomycetota bacterium]